MKTRSLLCRSTTLASIAGLALSASVAAQQQQRQPDRRTQDPPRQMQDQPRQTIENQRGASQFAQFSKVKGWKVENSTGENLGTISDLVIDRGSGQIRYVVVRHGGALGIGGKERLVSPREFSWMVQDERATLNVSKQDLETRPELDSMDWERHRWDRDPARRDRDQNDPARRHDQADSARHDDPYGRLIQSSAQRETVRGEITQVNRRSHEGGDEMVIVTLRTNDGQTRDIVTAPTWFLMSRQTAPRRGETAELEVVPLNDDRYAWGVATVATFDGERIQLRDQSGKPIWSDPSRSRTEYGTASHSFVQLSDVVGAPVVTKQRDLGKVQDALVDLTRQRTGFLAIDPNENFLGIADTIRLVPWEIARFTTDKQVDIDATDQMVLGSPEMPKDPSQLNNELFRDRVYQHFGVEQGQRSRGTQQTAAPSSTQQQRDRGGQR